MLAKEGTGRTANPKQMQTLVTSSPTRCDGGERRSFQLNPSGMANRSESASRVYNLLLNEDVIIEERGGQAYFVYEAFMEYEIAKGALAAVPKA